MSSVFRFVENCLVVSATVVIPEEEFIVEKDVSSYFNVVLVSKFKVDC